MSGADVILIAVGALLLFFAARFWQGDVRLLNGLDEKALSTMDEEARRQAGRALACFLGLVSHICLAAALGPKLAG